MKHTTTHFFFPTFASMNPAPQPAAEVNKAEIARGIFKQMFAMNPVPQRKDMINRAIAEAGLTKAGAATYLQNFKAKNGLTKPKAVAA